MYSTFESMYYCCQRIFEWITCKKQPTYTISAMENQDDCPYRRYQNCVV